MSASGCWICCAKRIREVVSLPLLPIQHILERIIALINPHILFLRVQAQVPGQGAGIIAVVPAAYIPVYLLKGNLPCQIPFLK